MSWSKGIRLGGGLVAGSKAHEIRSISIDIDVIFPRILESYRRYVAPALRREVAEVVSCQKLYVNIVETIH